MFAYKNNNKKSTRLKKSIRLKKTSNAVAAFFFFFQNKPVQRMKKFVALIIHEKGKTEMNKWIGKYDPDILQALCSVYK